MTERFGFTTAAPLVDAQKRYLKITENVETYYREKMRLLRQTGLSELEQVQQTNQWTSKALAVKRHLGWSSYSDTMGSDRPTNRIALKYV